MQRKFQYSLYNCRRFHFKYEEWEKKVKTSSSDYEENVLRLIFTEEIPLHYLNATFRKREYTKTKAPVILREIPTAFLEKIK